jgi:GT2 family glycosyltransferase
VLSVVIPTLGRPAVLARCLTALEAQRDLPGDFEVLVVADAREDVEAVDAAIGRRSCPVRRLRAELPGASAARNTGWRAAAHPLVLFLGDDVLAAPDLVAEHLAEHRRHPATEVGVLGPARWASELRVTPFMRWLQRGVQTDYDGIRGREASWAHLYTTNASLKRELLRRSGGFDEVGFPFLYEDTELGRRLADLGLVLRYRPEAGAEHLHAQTLSDWRARMATVAAAERRFVARHPDVPAHFHRLLSDAARRPRSRGRGVALLGLVSPRVPWLGPRVWHSADLRFRQELAPAFLAAWAAAEDEPSEATESAAPAAPGPGAAASGPK